MKNLWLSKMCLALGAMCLLAGCEAKTPPAPAEQATVEEAAAPAPADDIEVALAKLSPEDQVLAREQGYCAYANESRLGSMDMPYKLMIGDQPVFLCCQGCEKQALKDPEATLAKVAELKAKVQAEKN